MIVNIDYVCIINLQLQAVRDIYMETQYDNDNNFM